MKSTLKRQRKSVDEETLSKNYESEGYDDEELHVVMLASRKRFIITLSSVIVAFLIVILAAIK